MVESCRSMIPVAHQKSAVPLAAPAGAGRELFRIRVIVLLATLTGMLACLPLWLNTRDYPLVPISSWWPQLPPGAGLGLLILLLLALVGAVLRYRLGAGIFLAGALFLYCGDQNRGQPWFYLYWGLLLVLLAPEKNGAGGGPMRGGIGLFVGRGAET